VYFPVVVDAVEDICLAIIGQGLSFCLSPVCQVVSHRDGRQFLFSEGPAILIRKAPEVAFCEPTLPFKRMDDTLLANWKSNPRPLHQWSETFSAYRRCLESLPSDSNVQITDSMIAAKKEFHCQAQEVCTPAKVLFSDMEAEADGFEDVPNMPLLLRFKPFVDITSPGLVGKQDKRWPSIYVWLRTVCQL
jgi:hypothetical protein